MKYSLVKRWPRMPVCIRVLLIKGPDGFAFIERGSGYLGRRLMFVLAEGYAANGIFVLSVWFYLIDLLSSEVKSRKSKMHKTS